MRTRHNARLGFDGLVQTVGQATSFHFASRVGVDKNNFVALADVIDAFLVQCFCTQSVVDVVGQLEVGRRVQIAHVVFLLNLVNASFRQAHGAFLEVDNVIENFGRILFFVTVLAHVARSGDGLFPDGRLVLVVVRTPVEKGKFAVFLDDVAAFVADVAVAVHVADRRKRAADNTAGLFVGFAFVLVAGARNDKRIARFVDKNAVHFVDDCEVVTTLHTRFLAQCTVVAQVVEAELAVGAVSDVAGICTLLGKRRIVMQSYADGKSQEAVHLAHPFHIALGKIFIDCDNVYAFAAKRVEVGRQRFGKRFSFAGCHLTHHAAVKGNAAQNLHKIMTLSQHASSRLATNGKGFGQNFVQSFPLGNASFEYVCLRSQLFVGHFGVHRRQLFHKFSCLFQFFDGTAIAPTVILLHKTSDSPADYVICQWQMNK